MTKYRKVEAIYDTRKGWTDVIQNLAAFGMLGQFRKKASEALGVGRGAKVLDLCCGAGGNLKFLHDIVGDEGAIVAWDLSSGMLKSAAKEIRTHGWKNVYLVRGDAERLGLKPEFDAILSTYSMSIVPDHRLVLQAASQALRPGGKLVIFDRQLKPGGPFRSLFNNLIRPLGSKWHADWRRTPWEDLSKVTDRAHMQEILGGLYYLAWGYRPVS